MILELFQQLSGIALFFASGIFLSYLFFPKTDLVKRVVHFVLLSPLVAVITGGLLYLLKLFTRLNFVTAVVFLNVLFVLMLALKQKNQERGTKYNKDLWYLLFFSLLGTLGKWLFLRSIKNFGDAYVYAADFMGKKVPDLGFYTGMALDHSRFIGNDVFARLADFLSLKEFIDFSGTLLMTFLFLSFVYLIFSEFRNRKWALAGVALMSLGPLEIFYTTIGFFGHSFSYLALFSLFLFYRSKDKNYFLLPLLLCLALVFTYFTSAMINAALAFGFIIALFFKSLIKNKNLKKTVKSLPQKKIVGFILIIFISLSFVFTCFHSQKESSNLELITKHIISFPLRKYQDPSFLGLSAIRWQMIFFFGCGLTFVFYLIKKIKNKKDFLKEDGDLLLCLVPVLFVSLMFYGTNFPTRIFNYFAFFALLVVRIPKKYFKYFLTLSFVFILLTGFYVAKAKRPFFETSDKEIEAANWINDNLKEKIFSDQSFINHLVQNGYYNVTGVSDNDPLVYDLFYQKDFSSFLTAVNRLKLELRVDYLVLTKRMQTQYILMLDVPQKPLINQELYEENLKKIYDHGEVKIYKVE